MEPLNDLSQHIADAPVGSSPRDIAWAYREAADSLTAEQIAEHARAVLPHWGEAGSMLDAVLRALAVTPEEYGKAMMSLTEGLRAAHANGLIPDDGIYRMEIDPEGPAPLAFEIEQVEVESS
jgi:hypothetical protein